MTLSHCLLLLVLLLALPRQLDSSGLGGLLNGLGLGGGAGGGCPSPGSVCSCSIPCASYLGMAGGFGPGGGAGAYATGYGGHHGAGAGYAVPPIAERAKRTATASEEMEAHSDDQLCNSPHLRRVIKTNIVEDPDQSRNLIQKALRVEGRADFVVICTPNPFGFTATADSEYCSVASVVHSCYVFAF